MKFIKIIKNNLPLLFRFICHPRENGNPDSTEKCLDSRFHGNDRGSYSTKNLPPTTYHLPPKTYPLLPKKLQAKKLLFGGFTLIETLVAISILMVAVASPLTIAQKGLASAIYAKDQIIASYLAQDAIETIINVSGNNVAFQCNWLNGTGPLCTSGVDIKTPCASSCSVDTSTSNIILCSGSACTLKYDGSSHIYSYGSGDPSFTRSVKILENPTNEALITVTISWKDKGTDKSLKFYTRIYNWRTI
ncbi:MAG: seg [Parcubacteria group bacterium]|nr:seg [Parcubacteria group bacterium]